MPDTPLTASLLLAVLMGLGLAAACGFRVFVPLLVLSAAARAEAVPLSENFEWLASTPAFTTLVCATVLEIAAYYVPWLDNLLDTVATPAAAVAGAVVACASFVDMAPWLRWSMGLVAGAGLAAGIHVPMAALRAGSTATTGGVGNPAVATGELVSASLISAMAVFAPIAVPMVVIALVAGAVQWRRKQRSS